MAFLCLCADRWAAYWLALPQGEPAASTGSCPAEPSAHCAGWLLYAAPPRRMRRFPTTLSHLPRAPVALLGLAAMGGVSHRLTSGMLFSCCRLYRLDGGGGMQASSLPPCYPGRQAGWAWRTGGLRRATTSPTCLFDELVGRRGGVLLGAYRQRAPPAHQAGGCCTALPVSRGTAPSHGPRAGGSLLRAATAAMPLISLPPQQTQPFSFILRWRILLSSAIVNNVWRGTAWADDRWRLPARHVRDRQERLLRALTGHAFAQRTAGLGRLTRALTLLLYGGPRIAGRRRYAQLGWRTRM